MSAVAQRLRQKLLDLTIHGKLVPQDENDEPAEALLARIRAERFQTGFTGLGKDGRVEVARCRKGRACRSATAVPISDDEKPFDLPRGWCWCRLGEIFEHHNGKQLNGSDKVGELRQYITTSNVYWDRLELHTLKSMLFTDEEYLRCSATKGDLLVCEGGDIGRAAIWNEDYDIGLQNHIHRLRASGEIETRFFLFVFWVYKIQGRIHGKGIAIQGLSAKTLHNMPVPLPPLAEQKRIVAALDGMLAAADAVAAGTEKIAALKEKTRAKILDLAIRGKLVKQDKNDEPAEELLKRIVAERAQLVAKKKLKKEKPLPSIEADDAPYDLPSGWALCRLGEICRLYSGQDLAPACYNQEHNGIPYITGASNFVGCGIVENRWTTSPSVIAMEGDLLLTCKGTVGKTCVLNQERAHIARQVMAIRLSQFVDSRYAEIVICSNADGLSRSAIGLIPGIQRRDVLSLRFPLPPLAEQKRIVAKVDEMLAACDALTGGARGA